MLWCWWLARFMCRGVLAEAHVTVHPPQLVAHIWLWWWYEGRGLVGWCELAGDQFEEKRAQSYFAVCAFKVQRSTSEPLLSSFPAAISDFTLGHIVCMIVFILPWWDHYGGFSTIVYQQKTVLSSSPFFFFFYTFSTIKVLTHTSPADKLFFLPTLLNHAALSQLKTITNEECVYFWLCSFPTFSQHSAGKLISSQHSAIRFHVRGGIITALAD